MIRLVVGPPGAGKSTFVRDRAADADLVVDLDDIRASVGSEATAKALQKRLEADAREHGGDVWIVRTLADAQARAEFAARVGVDETVVMDTDAEIAKARVLDRDGSDEKVPVVDKWWADFTTNEGDVVLSDKEVEIMDEEQNQTQEQSKPEGNEERTQNEYGFPAETPMSEMTAEEQINYWKFHSRKHEKNSSELSAKLTREAEDAQKWRELQDEQKPASEKEVEQAVSAAVAETEARLRSEQYSRLFAAELKAASKDFPGLDSEALAGVLNAENFKTEGGDVDSAKITSFLESLPSGEKKESRRYKAGADQPYTGGSTVEVGRELYSAYKN